MGANLFVLDLELRLGCDQRIGDLVDFGDSVHSVDSGALLWGLLGNTLGVYAGLGAKVLVLRLTPSPFWG